MAGFASSWVVGPYRQVVERLVSLIGKHADPSGLMDSWPFDYKARVAHARDWHRLVTATAGNPAPCDLGDLETVDPKSLAAGWCPPVRVSLNMRRHFPTGLKRVGSLIRLTLDTPPDYHDYFIPFDMQSSG
jgi:hypothetical protein